MQQLVRRIAMRPRKVVVKLHRWLSIALFAWLVVIGLTGAWLTEHHAFESWLHPDRFHQTDGDVGPDKVLASASKAMPKGATVYSVYLPANGRGVYQAFGEVDPVDPDSTEEPDYYTAFVDPGTGKVNAVTSDSEGANAWLYRGHEYLWQDHGVFGVFDPQSGWCRADAKGHEPGGVKGVACDVIPDGMDMVAWFATGFIVVLLSGFYLWYWPGVRRWATALSVKRTRGRFTFHLSLHKAIGFVVWVPLLAVAFTGAAFAFPNMAAWYDNATPAQRDFSLWTQPESITSSKPHGRQPIGLDKYLEIVQERYPERKVQGVMPPFDKTGFYSSWVTRGFDPWTRQGGAGNAYVAVDQYSGKVVYDGIPGEGNVFDQAWDDWSFPVHTGDVGGWVTRLLWFGLGLSPIVLGVTGITMNLVRRGKRKKRVTTSPQDPAETAAEAEAAGETPVEVPVG